jgi:hypothetical protein
MTADEKRGNHVPFLVCFHTHDVTLQMQRWFDKYHNNHNASNGRPTIQGCAEAVEGLLCLERWIMEEKSVGEVMAANERVAHVLGLNPKRFPQRGNTLQWDLKKCTGHGKWQ